MQIWQAITLGAVQGLAEFLPISSSGHLLLLQRLFGIEENALFYSVMLHIGTLIPVFIVFFKQIISLFKKPFKKIFLLIVATIPSAVIGVLLGDLIDGVFYKDSTLSAILLAVTFLLTATELFIAERVSKRNQNTLPLNFKGATVMGFAQAIAIVPGLSRSGTVISSGVFLRLDREENANFAFLMSIPVILGAALLSGYKCVGQAISIDVLPLLFGMVTSAVTGYIAINLTLKTIKKANYKWFSIYLIAMAIVSVTEIIF